MSRFRRRPYIAVKEGEVVRCRWCGATESREWVHTEGGPWCSTKCRSASKYDESILIAIGGPILIFIGIILYDIPLSAIQSSPYLSLFLLLIFLPAFFGIPGIISGRSARSEIQFMSRRSQRTIDQEVHLQLCGHCGGPLESKRGIKSIECTYCGTINNVQAIVREQSEDDEDWLSDVWM